MKTNRRDFLKSTSVAGLTVASTAFLPGCSSVRNTINNSKLHHIKQEAEKSYTQIFNMSGYRAPKIETVRIGFIGVGNRGSAAVGRISHLEGVSIDGICDVRHEKATQAAAKANSFGHVPKLYTRSSESWKEMCDSDNYDLIYICTHWELHSPIAVYAMEQGKHVAVEIPAATTVDDCWKLVQTSEKTKRHCVILENCCYDFFELLTLNMVRQGFFGEIIHGEGAYIHDIIDSLYNREGRYDLWRLKENSHRDGNLYPTHGIGPVCQAMDINRGDRLDYMVAMSSKDFSLEQLAEKRAAEDSLFKEYIGKPFRGNINTSVIKTSNGRTIMLQHDVSSPRPYSRIHLISGTKGTAQKYPLPGKISSSHEGWLDEKEMEKLENQYTPPIVKKIGDLAKQIGGHGGMDFMMDWRLIDCLRNGLPMDMDVYDAAAWSVVSPLSEWSVANRSAPIDIPDFTGGSWKTNAKVDISLSEGANTGVKAMAEVG